MKKDEKSGHVSPSVVICSFGYNSTTSVFAYQTMLVFGSRGALKWCPLCLPYNCLIHPRVSANRLETRYILTEKLS